MTTTTCFSFLAGGHETNLCEPPKTVDVFFAAPKDEPNLGEQIDADNKQRTVNVTHLVCYAH